MIVLSVKYEILLKHQYFGTSIIAFTNKISELIFTSEYSKTFKIYTFVLAYLTLKKDTIFKNFLSYSLNTKFLPRVTDVILIHEIKFSSYVLEILYLKNKQILRLNNYILYSRQS